jgi:hypothetical protein
MQFSVQNKATTTEKAHVSNSTHGPFFVFHSRFSIFGKISERSGIRVRVYSGRSTYFIDVMVPSVRVRNSTIERNTHDSSNPAETTVGKSVI